MCVRVFNYVIMCVCEHCDHKCVCVQICNIVMICVCFALVCVQIFCVYVCNCVFESLK